ncbi:MerR family transcriptional regulator [Rhizobium sp. Leaf155]|nr:MerR family transcriptional regulator [Rhizobium sp. Leaf155]
MAKSYPDDLRREVIAFIDEGHTVREAAEKFSVSPSFAAKSHKRHVDAGQSQPLGEVEPADKVLPTVDDGEVSASELADLLGVSKRAVSDFVERGIVVKTERNRFDMRRSIQLYCEHLRTMAAGRSGDGADALTTERARLAREQADQTAMKNAVMRREMIPITDVRHEWTSIGRRIRNGIMSVPSRCRQMLPHLTTFDVDVIDRELRSALSDLGEQDDDRSLDAAAESVVGEPATASETEAVEMD